MTELSAAEAFRIFEEAREQRERADRAEAERDHWRAVAEQNGLERDGLRRTLDDWTHYLLGEQPAPIVPPAE